MKKQLLFFFLCSICCFTFSQQHILSSGNNRISSSGTVTYSVGLIHFKEATGSGGSSSVGSQIPYEILETLNVDEENLVSLHVFPNPTSNYLYVKLAREEQLTYTLSDISGREISNGKFSSLENKINLNDLNTSIYILHIYRDNNSLKSYKIIKK